MAERRTTPTPLSGADLNASLRAVGLRLGPRATTLTPPSPEHVVVSAVAEALPTDYRLLSVTTTWLGVHAPRLHLAELARLLPVAEQECDDAERFRAYWAGAAHWLGKDNRWSKVARAYQGKPVFLSTLEPEIARMTLERRGEDPRFSGSRLLVPTGLLRDRAADVDSPAALAKLHPWYRERVRQGPTYRADCWAELERDPTLTPARLAERVGCTYPVAHRAVEDWRLVA